MPARGTQELQQAEKREACRRYRTRGRRPAGKEANEDGPLFDIYGPSTRTLFTNGVPSTAAGVKRLLNAILQLDREPAAPPLPEPVRKPARLRLAVVQGGKPTRPR